jgi:hypothetical protein
MPAAADDDADGAADDIVCRTKLNLLLLFLFIYHYVDCDVALSCCRHLRSIRAAATALPPSRCTPPPRFALPPPPLTPCRRHAAADVALARCRHRR